MDQSYFYWAINNLRLFLINPQQRRQKRKHKVLYSLTILERDIKMNKEIAKAIRWLGGILLFCLVIILIFA